MGAAEHVSRERTGESMCRQLVPFPRDASNVSGVPCGNRRDCTERHSRYQ